MAQALKLADLLGDDLAQVLVCDVPGPPVSKGRPRATTRHGRVRLVTPEQTERGEAWVRHCWLDQVGQTLFTVALHVEIEVVLGVPRSWSRFRQQQAFKGHVRPTRKPDLDNTAKACLDALNGIAWLDDSQVDRLLVVKRYARQGEGEGVRLTVTIS